MNSLSYASCDTLLRPLYQLSDTRHEIMESTQIAAEGILQRAWVYGHRKLANVPEQVRARFEPARHRDCSRGRTSSRSGVVEAAPSLISSEEAELSLPPFKCPTEPDCPGHVRFCVYCYLNLTTGPVTPRTRPIPCKCPRTCPGYMRGKSCERVVQGTSEAGRVQGAEHLPVSRPADFYPRARAPGYQERSQSQPPSARISSIALPKIPPESLGFLETCALGYQLHWGWEAVEETTTAAQHFGFTPALDHCPDCREVLTFENLNLENLLRLTDLDGSRSDVPAMPCMHCTPKRRHRAKTKVDLVEGYEELVKSF